MAMSDIIKGYEEDGYCFPVDVLDGGEVDEIAAAISSARDAFAEDERKLNAVTQYPHFLLPQVYDLTRHRRVIGPVSEILGEDLLVWGASLFIKPPHTNKIVSWHQDLTYWDLDNSKETTCWVALSPVTEANGCMKFIPGSQRQRILPHNDTFAEDNMLSRGQEIAVEVDENEAVNVELAPGQASYHHGHLFHGSGPNRSDIARVAIAIRYIRTSMKQASGERPAVVLASGVDRYGYFGQAVRPSGDLTDEDFERCFEDMRIKQKMLFKGVEEGRGARYQ